MPKPELVARVLPLLPEHERGYTGKAFYAAVRRIVINNRETSPIVPMVPYGRRVLTAKAG